MLLLERKLGQIIRIDDDLVIEIADVRGDYVRLGTNVPGAVPRESLKLGSRFNIGDAITVIIIQIRRNSVKLGIDAPPHVTVHRQEIWERIQAERQKSSQRALAPPGQSTHCKCPFGQ